mmetsp:Transcript_4557/g.12755  ORF Transcript_4557/g.12755 Transcript_4557/m.12755 type:complete len:561 (+) Transcript_4557:89-1771(+)
MDLAHSERCFGVEIETWIPYGRAVSDDHLAQYFTDRGVPMIAVKYHGRGEGWKIEPDSSIKPDTMYVFGHTFEIVSPVLSGEAGLAELRRVLTFAKELGCRTNTSTGLHVHVDMRDYLGRTNDEQGVVSQNPNMGALRNVYHAFLRFEPAMELMLPPDRVQSPPPSRKNYIKSNLKTLRVGPPRRTREEALAHVQGLETFDDLQRTCGPVRADGRIVLNNRYHRLNLIQLWPKKYGTLEFRQHEGTIDCDTICNWVKFCIHFVETMTRSTPSNAQVEADKEACLTSLFEVLPNPALRDFYWERARQFYGASPPTPAPAPASSPAAFQRDFVVLAETGVEDTTWHTKVIDGSRVESGSTPHTTTVTKEKIHLPTGEHEVNLRANSLFGTCAGPVRAVAFCRNYWCTLPIHSFWLGLELRIMEGPANATAKVHVIFRQGSFVYESVGMTARGPGWMRKETVGHRAQDFNLVRFPSTPAMAPEHPDFGLGAQKLQDFGVQFIIHGASGSRVIADVGVLEIHGFRSEPQDNLPASAGRHLQYITRTAIFRPNYARQDYDPDSDP